MRFSTKQTVAPVAAIISTADAKTHLRVNTSTQDAYIDGLVTAAKNHIEKLTNRPLITQTWELWADHLPGARSSGDSWWDGVKDEPISHSQNRSSSVITMPFGNLVSISELVTYDDSDTAATFDASNYIVDAVSQPGRIILKNGSTWPANLRAGNGLKITAVFGYGSAATDVPQDLIHAAKMLMAHWFENRESVAIGTISKEIEQSLYALIEPYRIRNL